MKDIHRDAARDLATVSGIGALVLWGTVVAFSRSLLEQVGLMTGAACIHLVAGAAAMAWLVAGRERRRQFARLPRRYLLGCGAFFVAYIACLHLALGLAADRQQVIEVAIINYLWPSLTLALSIPILGRRGHWLIAPGMAVAFGGIVLALTGEGPFSWAGLATHLRAAPWAYVCALGCAVTWPLYSNLSRRWAGDVQGHAIPVFVLAAGIVLLLLRSLRIEETHWTPRAVAELLYIAFLPTLAAYFLWDRAMRRGNTALVSVLSYFLPLLSTAVSALYLGVRLPPSLWLATALVVAGALICWRGTRDP